MQAVQVIERLTDANANLARVSLVRLRHGDAEFIAAEPAARVGRPHRPLQLLGEHANRLIADVVAKRIVDLFEIVEVEHHQGEPPPVPLSGRDGAVDGSLELGPVGQSGQEVGPGLTRVLSRSVERDRDLVRHRGHEFEVARLERPGQPRCHGHGAQQHSFRTQLAADRAPLARDPVDTGFRPAGRNLDHLDEARATRLGELVLLAGLHPDRLGQLEPGALADPDRAGLQSEHLERFPQANLRDLGHVQGATKSAGDVVEPVELGLPGAMARLGVVEIAADEARVEMLDHVPQPALRQEEHLVGVFAGTHLFGDPCQDRPPEHRQAFHQGLEWHALLGVPLRGFPRHGVVLVPRHPGVGAERAEQDLQEGDRRLDQLIDRSVLVALEQVRLDRADRLGRDQSALGHVGRKPVGKLAQEAARPLSHIGAL